MDRHTVPRPGGTGNPDRSNIMILHKSQAEAVYSAMCALNNVGAKFNEFVFSGRNGPEVRNMGAGNILVDDGYEGVERYASQAAFATAYGLQQG